MKQVHAALQNNGDWECTIWGLSGFHWVGRGATYADAFAQAYSALQKARKKPKAPPPDEPIPA